LKKAGYPAFFIFKFMLLKIPRIIIQREKSMNKYYRCMEELRNSGISKMTAFGTSMMPMIKSGSTLTFQKCPEYEVNDVVFCKVRGRFIDAHKIIAKNKDKGYEIANNRGHVNGWTHTVYGRVIKIEHS